MIRPYRQTGLWPDETFFKLTYLKSDGSFCVIRTI